MCANQVFPGLFKILLLITVSVHEVSYHIIALCPAGIKVHTVNQRSLSLLIFLAIFRKPTLKVPTLMLVCCVREYLRVTLNCYFITRI